jgi:hypothetical protein
MQEIKLDIDLISEQLYVLLINELILQNNLINLQNIDQIKITANLYN